MKKTELTGTSVPVFLYDVFILRRTDLLFRFAGIDRQAGRFHLICREASFTLKHKNM